MIVGDGERIKDKGSGRDSWAWGMGKDQGKGIRGRVVIVGRVRGLTNKSRSNRSKPRGGSRFTPRSSMSLNKRPFRMFNTFKNYAPFKAVPQFKVQCPESYQRGQSLSFGFATQRSSTSAIRAVLSERDLGVDFTFVSSKT